MSEELTNTPPPEKQSRNPTKETTPQPHIPPTSAAAPREANKVMILRTEIARSVPPTTGPGIGRGDAVIISFQRDAL